MAFQAEPSRVHPRRRPMLNSPPTLSSQEGNFRIKKGETFHSPTTPPSEDRDPVMAFRSMPRRSPTCPQSLEAIVAGEQRMTDILGGLGLGSINSSSATGRPQARKHLPVSKGLVDARTGHNATAESSSKRPMGPPGKRPQHEHLSDSGLGTSISDGQAISPSDKGKGKAVQAGQLSVHALGNGHPNAQATQSAITSSISAFESNPLNENQLSSAAFKEVERYILQPILGEARLSPFYPLVESIPQRIANKEITCVRDLEKILFWLAPEYTAFKEVYLGFCEFTIQSLHTAVYHLNELDQKQPEDRSYTNGYFLDLDAQIYRYANVIYASRSNMQADGKSAQFGGEVDSSLDAPLFSTTEKHFQSNHVDPNNLTEETGSSKTVRPADLVIRPDGQATFMQPEKPCNEPCASALKRNLSIGSADEGVSRSMARRKKNAPPMDIKAKCPYCEKVFKRPCDLTKHEKTHSRPWKCMDQSCKYFNLGWPTEKERDRHLNDKHAREPSIFKCLYEPCTYQSKRESNCKQHMEKTHGWAYVRSKKNGKGARGSSVAQTQSSSGQTPQLSSQQTPQLSSQPPQSFGQQSPLSSSLQTPQSFSLATPPSGSASLSTPTTDPSPSPLIDYGWNNIDGAGLPGFDDGLGIGSSMDVPPLHGFGTGATANLDLQNLGNMLNSNLDMQSYDNGYSGNLAIQTFNNEFLPDLNAPSFDNGFPLMNTQLPTSAESVEANAMHAYSCDPVMSAGAYPGGAYAAGYYGYS